LRFPRRVGTSGTATDFAGSSIRYVIDTSENLVHWEVFDATRVASVSTISGPAGLEHLILVPLADSARARFWRLSVTRR
jgi:hypothetical protein